MSEPVDRSSYVLMGIDPGTRACGWAIGTLDGVLIASGAILLPEDMSPHLRAYRVAEALAVIALEHGVVTVYCEAPFVFKSAKGTLILGGLSYVIGYVLWRCLGETEVNYIEASSVRSIIGIPGVRRKKGEKQEKGAAKKLALKTIRERLDDMGVPYDRNDRVPVGEDDRLEAIGIFWAGCHEISYGIDEAICAAETTPVSPKKQKRTRRSKE